MAIPNRTGIPLLEARRNEYAGPAATEPVVEKDHLFLTQMSSSRVL